MPLHFVNYDDESELDLIVTKTEGYSGAEIASLTQVAGMLALEN